MILRNLETFQFRLTPLETLAQLVFAQKWWNTAGNLGENNRWLIWTQLIRISSQFGWGTN